MRLQFFCSLVLLSVLNEALAEDPNQALLAAASEGRIERLVSLMASGADVNFKSPAGRTSLMIAATSGNTRVLRKLLAFGADPNVADGRGVTALMEAAKVKDTQCARISWQEIGGEIPLSGKA